MKKKVVFIMSSGHSGSSLLALILGSHPNCFSTGELCGLPNRYRKKKPIDCVNMTSDFWENTFGKQGLNQLASVLGNTRINRYLPLKLEKTIRQALGQDDIFNPYSFMFSKLANTNVIVDASKAYQWIDSRLSAKEFTSGNLDAYLIHLVRDGRAVINSYLRKYPHWDVKKISEDWLDRTRQRERFFEQFPLDRRVQVAYEELATDPYQTTEKICRCLNIDFSPSMIEYWKYEHHDISGNEGTYSLIRRYQGNEVDNKEGHLHGDYYKKADMSIRLDLRWQHELLPEKLEVFERIAGDANRPFRWDGDKSKV